MCVCKMVFNLGYGMGWGRVLKMCLVNVFILMC